MTSITKTRHYWVLWYAYKGVYIARGGWRSSTAKSVTAAKEFDCREDALLWTKTPGQRHVSKGFEPVRVTEESTYTHDGLE